MAKCVGRRALLIRFPWFLSSPGCPVSSSSTCREQLKCSRHAGQLKVRAELIVHSPALPVLMHAAFEHCSTPGPILANGGRHIFLIVCPSSSALRVRLAYASRDPLLAEEKWTPYDLTSTRGIRASVTFCLRRPILGSLYGLSFDFHARVFCILSGTVDSQKVPSA